MDAIIGAYSWSRFFDFKGNIEFEFSDKTIDERCLFDSVNHENRDLKKVSFYDCHFNTILVFTDLYEIKFDNCTIKEIQFADNLTNKLSFTNQTYVESFFIRSFKGNIYIEECIIERLRISGSGVKEMNVLGDYNNKKINSLNPIRDNDNSRIFDLIYDCKSHGLTPGKINFSDIIIKKIRLTGDNSNELVFRNIVNDILRIKGFTNSSKLRFYGFNEFYSGGMVFAISQSNMVNTQLFRYNFQSYRKILMIDSYIAGMLFYNVTWKENFLYLRGGADRVLKKQTRESYRQLRLAMRTQLDRPQELAFYAMEMNLFNDTIHWTWSNCWDKINLTLSKFFSNYGQSFTRPSISWLVLNYFLYVWYVRARGLPLIVDKGLINFYKEMGCFFRLMSPVRKMDDVIYETSWPLDIISRIISTYFIFLIFRFIRKYIVKS